MSDVQAKEREDLKLAPFAGVAGSVRTVLNYTHKTGERPRSYAYGDVPSGVPRLGGQVDPREVSIRNGRVEGDLTLDRSGLELLRHPTSALREWADCQDAKRVRAVYYPEVEAALAAHTGAEKVVVFDHTLRDSSAAPGHATVRDPVDRIHNDQTFDSAPNRVKKHLPDDEAAVRLQRRFAIVNFWRPIGEVVQRLPLAACDARSIAIDDFIVSDLVYADWTGEIYYLGYNPAHRWYWFPRQAPDEVTLLKIYDSATGEIARLSAHTAFHDPASATEGPPRRSIEIRALLFW